LLSVPYCAGFPLDQPIWSANSTSATYTNVTGTTPYQNLTFPSTSDKLTYLIFQTLMQDKHVHYYLVCKVGQQQQLLYH